jgi:hypothetical protein
MKNTRRRFLQAAAVGAAALPLIATPAAAGDPPPSIEASLTAVVRQRYKHLTEAQVKTVQAGIQRGLAAAAALNRLALTPLDEPATIFLPDVAE